MYIYILPVCKNLLISWLNYMQFIVCQLFISKVFFKEKPKILALNIWMEDQMGKKEPLGMGIQQRR